MVDVLSFEAKEGLEAGVLDTTLAAQPLPPSLCWAEQGREGESPFRRFLKAVERSLHCLSFKSIF